MTDTNLYSTAVEDGRRLARELIQGRQQELAKRGKAEAERRGALRRADEARIGAAEAAGPGLLLAIGDSWFAYWPQGDVLDVLEKKYHYEVDTKAKAGVSLKAMTLPNGQLKWLLMRIAELTAAKQAELGAILISGGGNDIVGDQALFKSLFNRAEPGVPLLNPEAVHETVDIDLRRTFTQIITAVTELCIQELGRRIPIVLHGYDYPVADNRDAVFFGPWLQPGLVELGYTQLEQRKDAMQALIDKLNEMQIDLAAQQGFGHIAHVDLRGTLHRNETYKLFWQNELHPTIPRGFTAIADRIAAKLLPS